MLQTSSVFYFNTNSPGSSYSLKEQLVKMLHDYDASSKDIVIVCIGSDRSTGDSLGPLIGYKLERFSIPGVTVYGTLNSPVHAANLEDSLNIISHSHPDSFVIAIDASLGTKEHVGYITVGHGPLRPGLGVKKDLPCVGDMHITGIVNFSGMMESLLLQTTRLSKVMQLADAIARGVLYSLMELR